MNEIALLSVGKVKEKILGKHNWKLGNKIAPLKEKQNCVTAFNLFFSFKRNEQSSRGKKNRISERYKRQDFPKIKN